MQSSFQGLCCDPESALRCLMTQGSVVCSPPLSVDWRGSQLDDTVCRRTGSVRRETVAVAVNVPSVGAGCGVRSLRRKVVHVIWEGVISRPGFGWVSEDMLKDHVERVNAPTNVFV